MCGICGIYHFDSTRPAEQAILNRMCQKLFHRGPDDEGYYLHENVGLGMRRLSVIDLETGHQPIFNENRSKIIIFNGEIYNFPYLKANLEKKGHSFRTKSDTETMVHLYEEKGLEFLKELNGIFALALYDQDEKKLILARDFVGVKPLYYYLDDHGLIFASEIRAILVYGVSREIDPQALSSYLTLGYVPSPRTIFKKIKKLPPAHFLIISSSGIKLNRYWQLNYRDHSQKSTQTEKEEYAQKLLSLMKEAVKRQLISDVPLGVLLSGGVDSSGIAALAGQCMDKPLNTFSIGFKNKGYYDERTYARKVAELFGTNHYEFEVEDKIEDSLPKIASYFDEPFADSSAIPTYYVSKLAKEHVKVVLSGTGGDDIFAGYRRYASHKLAKYFHIFPMWFLKSLSSQLKMMRASRKTVFLEYILLARRLLDTVGLNDEDRYFRIMSIFPPEERRKLLIEDDPLSENNLFSSYFDQKNNDDFLNRLLYVDFNTYLPDDLLVKEDRMTMAHSLEGRVPFLDKEVIEFAATLPPHLKLKGHNKKYILKLALSEVLPPSIIQRRKHGFALPIEDLFRGELKAMTYDSLLSRHSGTSELFNPTHVKEMIEKHQNQQEDYSQKLWALLMFELWHKNYCTTS